MLEFFGKPLIAIMLLSIYAFFKLESNFRDLRMSNAIIDDSQLPR